MKKLLTFLCIIGFACFLIGVVGTSVYFNQNPIIKTIQVAEQPASDQDVGLLLSHYADALDTHNFILDHSVGVSSRLLNGDRLDYVVLVGIDEGGPIEFHCFVEHYLGQDHVSGCVYTQ